MQKFKPKNYTILDIINWDESEQLTLNPDFQRRDVWHTKAKSYLIDTILNGKPIPKLFIRELIDRERKVTIRDVIDGQQRLRAIIGFYKNEFKVKIENDELSFSGFYKDLPTNIKDEFDSYDLSIDIVQNMSQEEIIDVFARLNTFTFALNKQELLNSEFFGEFKTLVYQTAKIHSNFWIKNNIFTLRKINRMADAELVSDIIASLLDGPTARGEIKKTYEKYDDNLPNKKTLVTNISKTFNLIDSNLGSFLPTSNFNRPQLFYGLFLATYHNFISSLDFLKDKQFQFEVEMNDFKTEIQNLDYDIQNENFTTIEGKDFFNAYRSQTTNKKNRETVVKYILKRILH